MQNSKDYVAYKEKGLADEFSTIGNYNIFMQCDMVRSDAFRELPTGYSFRLCRHNELEVWKRIIVHEQYIDYVTDYYNRVYSAHEDEFFRRCLFVCDTDDKPIASCLLWRSYGLINTIGWFAVLPKHEGKGLGRALISKILKYAELPVYLHTQPTSARAIKLYSDFGFKLINDTKIGHRENDLAKSLPYLQKILPPNDYEKLQYVKAHDDLHKAALSSETAEF